MRAEDIDIISELQHTKELQLDESRYSLVFPKVGNEEIISKLNKLGIETEDSGLKNKEIDLQHLPFNTFYNETDFLNRVSKNSWANSIYIHKENIFFSPSEEKTYSSFQITHKYFLVSNNFYSFKFFDFLKTQEHQENSAFYFVDYFNWDTRHIVLTSLQKNGKVDIILPSGGVPIYDEVNLKFALDEFKKAFDENNKHFPKFIKIELIATLSKVEKSKRLETLLRKLHEIVYVANQNFEIYLHDLSLENLKKDFIEHKNKYFIQLREILSKLTNQIIGLPIAIGASVFSTYKVADSNFTLIIILVVFLLYAFYSVFLIKLQKEDIQDIQSSFNSEFMKLSESDFFKKFPDELLSFSKIKSNLTSRMNIMKTAMNSYFTFFSLSSIAFVVYDEMQLQLSTAGIIVTNVVIAALFLTIYRYTQTLRSD